MATENYQYYFLADDIILIGDRKEKLQAKINHVESYCYKWRLCVNKDKTKVMQSRNKMKARSITTFMFGRSELKMVKQYK